MPIVDVTLVQPAGAVMAHDLAQRLANGLGKALGQPEARLWVRLHELPHERYAENGAAVAGDECPVFVSVLLARLPPPEVLQAHAATVASAVAAATERPIDRVHVEYAPAGAGRVAFGGKLTG